LAQARVQAACFLRHAGSRYTGGVTDTAPVTASKAFARLVEGNRRFASNVRSLAPLMSQLNRDELAGGQRPFAVVLGCSDSRAPAEILFDQGLGDLFVIRVAGNVVAPSQVGSVEFGVEAFGPRLVVVMGHTRCGAVRAAVDVYDNPAAAGTQNLRAITDRLRPAVASVRQAARGLDRDALESEIMRANVRASADHLRHGSSLLERLCSQEGLVIVGAAYDLDTGVVDFFDGVPAEFG
jgi:carbonic anhydrase